MGEHPGRDDRHQQRIREWQLLLLRFAITRDVLDRDVAASQARELDAMRASGRSAFAFFTRTTAEICQAVAQLPDERARSMLRTFTARIDDTRLKDAFSAAVGLQDCATSTRRKPRAAWRDRQDLWRGLPKR
ncbi:hypothetical protein [Bradyrhizobium sp. LHD-71]|uniref:hypothetical protein n=1 Tax=Bradyrhizobium sp. LHD-71 TaxID=3072141 RepID=UPI00280D9E2A|nr:hypothetical protein [Bradyrhizobium sp. LHD-71]MDQ8727718.1 hypothetical protein [Bradyrhizobium sp. LHD-71]